MVNEPALTTESTDATANAAPPTGYVARSEYAYALRWAIAIMAATCLPYLFCWVATPPGYVYPGLLYLPDDHGLYWSWIRQARDGHFFFHNLFSIERQSGHYVHLYFWLLGTLARIPGLSIAIVYHASRVVMGVVVLVLVYRLASFFVDDRFTRRTIYWTAAVSAGFGWLYGLGAPIPEPIDNLQVDAITFESLYMNGLFATSLALILGIIVCLLCAQFTGRCRYAVGAGLCVLLLANVHTYDILTIACLWGAYLAAVAVVAPQMLVARLRDAAIALLVAAPGLVCQFLILSDSGVFGRRVAMPVLSPPFSQYLLGYGLLVPLAIHGLWLIIKSRNLRSELHLILLPVWLFVGLAVPYVPMTFQRKLIMGFHFPVALLAGISISWLASVVGRRQLNIRWRAVTATVLIAATALTSLRYVERDLLLAVRAERSRSVKSSGRRRIWWSAADNNAMRWMSANLPQDAVILCSPRQYGMAGETGRTVYVGHWGETPDWRNKASKANLYYSGAADPTFPGQVGITHVFFGDDEHAISKGARLNGRPGFTADPLLQRIYDRDGTVVYSVLKRTRMAGAAPEGK